MLQRYMKRLIGLIVILRAPISSCPRCGLAASPQVTPPSGTQVALAHDPRQLCSATKSGREMSRLIF